MRSSSAAALPQSLARTQTGLQKCDGHQALHFTGAEGAVEEGKGFRRVKTRIRVVCNYVNKES